MALFGATSTAPLAEAYSLPLSGAGGARLAPFALIITVGLPASPPFNHTRVTLSALPAVFLYFQLLLPIASQHGAPPQVPAGSTTRRAAGASAT